MSSAAFIDPVEFVNTVTPLIERRDVCQLVALIKRRWTLAQVLGLLQCGHVDARKVASLVLSLVGTEHCLDELARQLKDPDPMLNQMAEHAMWAIWFRCGNECANSHIARGAQYLAKKELDNAVAEFSLAIAADPDFAEAYNQRAMAYYLLERFPQSLADCRAAVALMPMHFGAWAGMGHCHACLGNTADAIDCYNRARQINPHLECLDDLIEELSESRREDEAA